MAHGRAPRRMGPVAAVLLMVIAGTPSAGAAASDAVCPAPYGTALVGGAHAFLGNNSDPETGLVDTLRMSGAQRSPATVLGFGGRLTLVAEVKVDDPPAFTWGVLVRFYSNDTGWDTAPRWASSVDPSVAYPVGFHVRPATALWNASLYVAWTAEGSPAGGPTDRLLLMRRVAPDGSMDPWVVASDTDPRRANQHPALVPAGPDLYLAYSAGQDEADPAATHIAVRAFDGSSFGPSEVITTPPPGWSDELPSLAWDEGHGLFAVWTRTNTSGLGAVLMFSQRSATGWSVPFQVAPLGQASDANPAAAVYGGLLYVAYSTDHPTEVLGPDADVKWRAFDPGTGGWNEAASVNPQPSAGSDSAPTFSVVGGTLYVGWSSTDDFYSHGSDTDPLYRTFNGSSLGPTVEMVPPDDNASDGPPRFVAVGGTTYAHFMWTPPVEPGAPRGDSREVVRVIDRPLAWFDTLTAGYRFPSVSENGSALLSVVPPGGAAVPGALHVRLPSGAVFPMSRVETHFEAWVPVDPARPDFEVLACGAPVGAAPLPSTTPPPTDWGPALMVAGVAVMAVAAYAVARGFSRPKK